MSTLLLSLARENPFPGLAVASLNLVVGFPSWARACLLGITISLLAWVHAFADREPLPHRAKRRATP